VHQEENVITVQRHNPINHKAVYAICHTAFYGGGSNFGQTPKFTVKIPHKITKLLFAAQIDVEMSLRVSENNHQKVLRAVYDTASNFCAG
jgi:hypothetical protein